MIRTASRAGLGAAFLFLVGAAPAFAHHAMGGDTPTNFGQGLISGLAHPVIGFDHLAFVIAVGIAAAFSARRYLTPLAFVAATLAGCGIQIAGVALPLPELLISLSIVVLGGIVLSGRKLNDMGQIGVFAVAGLFHGWAYGQSIVGAETTPLIAYLIGFGAVQYIITLAAQTVVVDIWKGAASEMRPRLAGAVVAGVGLTFLVENVEGMILG